MLLVTAAGISAGLLVALLALFAAVGLAAIAVLRKLGQEDRIPEAIRQTSAYTTLFPGFDDDDADPPFVLPATATNPMAGDAPAGVEMRIKDAPLGDELGTEL